MKIIDCVQGTTEWLQARAGIPTASNFDRILTPGGKLSTQAEKYLHHLLAERILGRPIVEQAVTPWMHRGTEMEAEAVSFYESFRDLDTVRVGFCTTDDGTLGCSPDRLVGDDGLAEIKCPKEAVLVGYLLSGSVGDAYKPQVQGQLLVTGRVWVDVLAYSPELPHSLIRVERDEKYLRTLGNALVEFTGCLADATSIARDRGWLK